MARPKSDIPMLNFTVRISVAQRDQFVAACIAADILPTQVIRAAIRDYLAKHKGADHAAR